MNAGNLNKRITLQKPDLESDGQGGRRKKTGGTGWVDVATVWAEFKAPKVKELAATGTIVGDLTREISIRRRSDVRRGWRATYTFKGITKTFDIQHVYDPDLETTVLVCREVVR
ncbi:MAG: phage head closure protein [Veillonellales bacterium]